MDETKDKWGNGCGSERMDEGMDKQKGSHGFGDTVASVCLGRLRDRGSWLCKQGTNSREAASTWPRV